MDYTSIIKLAGERMGLDEFVPNEEGECSLVVDDKEITIQYCADVDTILISSPIAEATSDFTAENYRRICEANFLFAQTHGATLSIDPQSSVIYLIRYDFIKGLDPDTFCDHLTGFAAAMAELPKTIFMVEKSEGGQDGEAFDRANSDFVMV